MIYTIVILPFKGPLSRSAPHSNTSATAGTHPGSPGGLVISSLDQSVQHYFQLGLAPSTQKVYQAAMKRFHSFCCKFSVFNPFPVTEHLLCSFIAYLADEGLSPQTCKSYLAAVRNMQISLGLPDLRDQSSWPILKRVQAGISRARSLRGESSRVRLLITAHILGQLKEKLLSSSHPEKITLWAIASTAFFGFFQLRELLLISAPSFNCRFTHAGET